MGANLVYLPRPNKKKHTIEGRANNFKFVLSSMQGWRLNMVTNRISLQSIIMIGRCTHM